MTEWWAPPLAAGLVLTAIHCHLGQHVLARGVIFVDLALAQAAALGAMVALIYGHAPGSGVAYALSLGTALAVAGLLAVTRDGRRGIPQEAVIGVIYAVTSAAAIVLLDSAQDPHAGEHVRGATMVTMVAIYTARRRGNIWPTAGARGKRTHKVHKRSPIRPFN